MEYKKVKFTANRFGGSTNAKRFMQAQLLRFCKDAAKVSSVALLRITTKSATYQYCGLSLKQIEHKKSENVTSKHRAVKSLQIAKTFSKNMNKEVT